MAKNVIFQDRDLRDDRNILLKVSGHWGMGGVGGGGGGGGWGEGVKARAKNGPK